MATIKEQYQRFRKWQEQPFKYQDGHDHHGCCNCGAESENNYCPRCGQKAVYGPITWHSVGQGILDVWGVGTRSLPYSLWQLIWRPGYLIRDYINGKRQASFPPVKMLVIVAVVLALLNNLLGMDYTDNSGGVAATDFESFFDAIFDWMGNHIAWAVLIGFSLFIVPVWFLFRKAPRLPRHTLPQGFYIQVFIGVQFVLFMLLLLLLFYIIPNQSNNGNEATAFMLVIILPIMLMCDYKQLFGYGWWGTIWRVLVAILLALFVGKVVKCLGGIVYYLYQQQWSESAMYLVRGVDKVAMLWVLLEIVNIINSKSWRNNVWGKPFIRLILALVALLLTTFVCNRLGVNNSIDSILESMDAFYN